MIMIIYNKIIFIYNKKYCRVCKLFGDCFVWLGFFVFFAQVSSWACTSHWHIFTALNMHWGSWQLNWAKGLGSFASGKEFWLLDASSISYTNYLRQQTNDLTSLRRETLHENVRKWGLAIFKKANLWPHKKIHPYSNIWWTATYWLLITSICINKGISLWEFPLLLFALLMPDSRVKMQIPSWSLQ